MGGEATGHHVEMGGEGIGEWRDSTRLDYLGSRLCGGLGLRGCCSRGSHSLGAETQRGRARERAPTGWRASEDAREGEVLPMGAMGAMMTMMAMIPERHDASRRHAWHSVTCRTSGILLIRRPQASADERDIFKRVLRRRPGKQARSDPSYSRIPGCYDGQQMSLPRWMPVCELGTVPVMSSWRPVSDAYE